MPYAISLLPKAEKHYLFWKRDRPEFAAKIDALFDAMRLDPFGGVGKPEPLKHDMQGFWSRRITEGHRILYKVAGDSIIVYRCYGHYL